MPAFFHKPRLFEYCEISHETSGILEYKSKLGSPSFHQSLRWSQEVKMAKSQSIRNGQKFVENGATIILGISIGNSYYNKVENIQKLLEFARTKSDKVSIKI